MTNDYKTNLDFGFILSQIQALHLKLFDKEFYKMLLKSKDLSDIIVKLSNSKYSKYINEGTRKSKKIFKNNLRKYYRDEVLNILKYCPPNTLLEKLLKYLIRSYKIDAFILAVTSKKGEIIKVPEEDLGYFTEVNVIKLMESVDQVLNMLDDKNFIKKFLIFFRRDLNENLHENNFQEIHLKFHKKNIEDLFSDLTKLNLITETASSILKIEGSIFNMENIMNSISLKKDFDKKVCFSNVSYFDYKLENKLMETKNIEDFLMVLEKSNFNISLRDSFSSNSSKEFDYVSIIEKFEELKVHHYNKSFDYFNDVVAVYSFLRLKEREVKNIIYIVDMLNFDEKNIKISSKF